MKASKPKAGGKAWPFSKAAKKHAKAGRAMVRAVLKVPEGKLMSGVNKKTYVAQFFNTDNFQWVDIGEEYFYKDECIKFTERWREFSPLFDFRTVERWTQISDRVIEPKA